MPSSAPTCSKRPLANQVAPNVFVLIGPGGAGKGTVAARLVDEVDRLWLSRSWTTRRRRPEEPADAYVFAGREEFQEKAEVGGFVEWAEFLGELYGTPWPEPPPGSDVLLEIDVQGARQIRDWRPDAVIVLLLPPSSEVLAERLARRGDRPERALVRIEKGREEAEEGRRLADHTVVNDDLDQAIDEVAAIVERSRAARR